MRCLEADRGSVLSFWATMAQPVPRWQPSLLANLASVKSRGAARPTPQRKH